MFYGGGGLSTFYTDKMIQIIKGEYPDSDNDILSKKLGISQSALKTKASRLGIKKSEKYKVKFNRSMKIKTRGKIPGFCFSLLTLIIVILFEVLGLIADHQLSFNNCQTISSTVINICYVELERLLGTSGYLFPMDLITIQFLIINCLGGTS